MEKEVQLGTRKVMLAFVRETKGTFIYSDKSEVDDECLFPALYLKKKDMPTSPPMFIQITMEWAQ